VTSAATPPGPHLDDGQLSSLVDGLAGPDEQAHAEACPQCAGRLGHWRRAHDLVATPPARPGAARFESAVQAGLAAFDSGTSQQPRPAAVIDLAAARRRPTARPRRRALVATAAAALIAVAGLGFALSRTTDHHPHESANSPSTAPASSTASEPGASPSATGSGLSSSGASSAAPPEPAEGVIPLGSVPDMTALVVVLRSHIGEQVAGPSAAASGSSTSPQCQAAAAGVAGVGTSTSPEFRGTLTYAGIPAQVYAYRLPGSTVAVVLGLGPCSLLAKRSF
jgi:hypothetical protein